MPSLVVIAPQIKETQRGHNVPPACILPKYPSLNRVKLNTRLPTKKIGKSDVDVFREEGKRFKSQIHLIIISRDC